jgi:hypothetical protein
LKQGAVSLITGDRRFVGNSHWQRCNKKKQRSNKLMKKAIYATAILMLLTGLLHSLSLVAEQKPANETERQLLDLMTNYKMDPGAGFHPSLANLWVALSSCFSLLYLFGGTLLIYLCKRNLDSDTMKGVLNIALIFFGIGFAMMAYFTFLPPIICTGLVFVGLAVSRFRGSPAQRKSAS